MIVLLILLRFSLFRPPSSGSGRVRSVSCFAVLLAFLLLLVGRLPVRRAPCGSAGFINVLKLAVFSFLAVPFLIEPTWSIVLVSTFLGFAFVLEMRTA